VKLEKARGRLSEIIAVYSQEVGDMRPGDAAIEAIVLDAQAARELRQSCEA
jgi:hypothetical protein